MSVKAIHHTSFTTGFPNTSFSCKSISPIDTETEELKTVEKIGNLEHHCVIDLWLAYIRLGVQAHVALSLTEEIKSQVEKLEEFQGAFADCEYGLGTSGSVENSSEGLKGVHSVLRNAFITQQEIKHDQTKSQRFGPSMCPRVHTYLNLPNWTSTTTGVKFWSISDHFSGADLLNHLRGSYDQDSRKL